MGAWIETGKTMSMVDYLERVAPLMGAWIETPPLSEDLACLIVAPLMGAWIETR